MNARILGRRIGYGLLAATTLIGLGAMTLTGGHGYLATTRHSKRAALNATNR